MANQGDHDPLDDEFLSRKEIGEVGVFCLEVGTSVFDKVALECGLAIDEGGNDITGLGLFEFEDDVIPAHDVGVDHGIAPHLESKGASVAWNAEGIDIDRDAALLLLLNRGGATGRDLAVDRNVEDLGAAELLWKNDGACFVGQSLDDAFFLQCSEVAHGGGLAGEAEVALDLPGGGHEAAVAMILTEIVEQLLLSVGKGGLGG